MVPASQLLRRLRQAQGHKEFKTAVSQEFETTPAWATEQDPVKKERKKKEEAVCGQQKKREREKQKPAC